MNQLLYYLLDDPSETNNLANKYPERVQVMRKRLTEMLKDAVSSGTKGPEDEL